MKIDRSNYEIWIIDWLDGNLNDNQTALLYQFLEENTSLKEELSEIELLRLKPPENKFKGKTGLKKSFEDLSQTQFEYMCAAFIENDLSPDQQDELEKITKHDPERKKTLELTGKAKLNPVSIIYPDKKLLYRRSVLQKAGRLSFIGLSAAAVTAIAFILYFSKTPELPVGYETTSQAIVNDTSQRINPGQKIPETEVVKNITIKKPTEKLIAAIHSYARSTLQPTDNKTSPGEPEFKRTEISVRKIKIHPEINFEEKVPVNLVSFNFQYTPVQAEESGSKIGRFIAKTFREKFLKEKAPEDSPLKGFEIAKAGVTGLNKLLGWEMALDEKKDHYGNPKSVYFSSKLLKFNAPIKNSETSR